MCGKCVAACPVSVDSCALKQSQRSTITNKLPYNYSFLNDVTINSEPHISDINAQSGSDNNNVLYFAGCMTHLTPAIIKSMTSILRLLKRNMFLPIKREAFAVADRLYLQEGRTPPKRLLRKTVNLFGAADARPLFSPAPSV